MSTSRTGVHAHRCPVAREAAQHVTHAEPAQRRSRRGRHGAGQPPHGDDRPGGHQHRGADRGTLLDQQHPLRCDVVHHALHLTARQRDREPAAGVREQPVGECHLGPLGAHALGQLGVPLGAVLAVELGLEVVEQRLPAHGTGE